MLIQLRRNEKAGLAQEGWPGAKFFRKQTDYGVEYGIVTVTRVQTGLPFLTPGL